MRFEVGESGEVTVPEGEPVVVVADIEHLTEPIRQTIHEAEVAAVGTAPYPGWLERNTHRFAQRPFDLEFDLFAVGLPYVKYEIFLGGEKLPVEKVLQDPAIHRQQLGAWP